jgi:thiol-disulfide isomerase/thioredoxin
MSQGTRYAYRGRPRRSPWALPAVAVALAVIVAVAVVRGLGGGRAAAEARTPVPSEVMADLTQIPAATWDAVGAKDAVAPTFVGSASAPAAGKPLVLYVGAEYCPFCAAERWSLVTALARFGTFQGLAYSHSAGDDVYPNTPTFTFYGATYTSPYLDFQAVETLTNVRGGPDGYTNLQTPTRAQQTLLDRYDAAPYFAPNVAGHIPFLLVGERYAWVGSAFSPQSLAGRTQAGIAADLAAGRSATAQAILANANEIAAAICAADGGQPASVCGSAGVTAAARILPAAAAK